MAKESAGRVYWDGQICEEINLEDIDEEKVKKPTNAGVLFFAKNPQRFILQSQLRLARFAGKTLTRDFLDKLDCSGTLWEMIEGAEGFVKNMACQHPNMS